MADVVDKTTRSRMMSGIRSGNTRPERLLRSALHRRGYRFRINVRSLQGTPDIVLQRFNAAIFVNGCFWHGHNCSYFKWPKTNRSFWRIKISANKARDTRKIRGLRADGWRVRVIWECATRKERSMRRALLSLVNWIER